MHSAFLRFFYALGEDFDRFFTSFRVKIKATKKVSVLDICDKEIKNDSF